MKKPHFIIATASVAAVGIAAVAIGVSTLANKEDIVIHGEKVTSSETSETYVYSTSSSTSTTKEPEDTIMASSTIETTSSTPIEIEDNSVPEEVTPITPIDNDVKEPVENPVEEPVESKPIENVSKPEPVATTTMITTAATTKVTEKTTVTTTTSKPVETPTESTSGKPWSLDMEIGDITDQGYVIIGKTPDEGIPYIALDEEWETQQMVIIGYASWGAPLYSKDRTAWYSAHEAEMDADLEWFIAHNGHIG